jgi:hypothetical protein
MKDFQATGTASSPKRTFYTVYLFCLSFLVIFALLDPDPKIPLNPDTDLKQRKKSEMSAQVGELMTAILGPDGGGGSLEDTITLVLVKKVRYHTFYSF